MKLVEMRHELISRCFSRMLNKIEKKEKKNNARNWHRGFLHHEVRVRSSEDFWLLLIVRLFATVDTTPKQLDENIRQSYCMFFIRDLEFFFCSRSRNLQWTSSHSLHYLLPTMHCDKNKTEIDLNDVLMKTNWSAFHVIFKTSFTYARINDAQIHFESNVFIHLI